MAVSELLLEWDGMVPCLLGMNMDPLYNYTSNRIYYEHELL